MSTTEFNELNIEEANRWLFILEPLIRNYFPGVAVSMADYEKFAYFSFNQNKRVYVIEIHDNLGGDRLNIEMNRHSGPETVVDYDFKVYTSPLLTQTVK
jgi:hypothetical protein